MKSPPEANLPAVIRPAAGDTGGDQGASSVPHEDRDGWVKAHRPTTVLAPPFLFIPRCLSEAVTAPSPGQRVLRSAGGGAPPAGVKVHLEQAVPPLCVAPNVLLPFWTSCAHGSTSWFALRHWLPFQTWSSERCICANAGNW